MYRQIVVFGGGNLGAVFIFSRLNFTFGVRKVPNHKQKTGLNDKTKFVLIGSGLAGGLLAAYLGRRGCDVDLYERRTDPRAGNFVGGRAINLALSTRGIHALAQLGIADDVLQYAIPMRGRMIHDKSGALHFAPYDVDPNKYINSIGRAALNTTVIEAAQRYPNVRVHFNHLCTDFVFNLAKS